MLTLETHVFFDGPDNYPLKDAYYAQGSSPKLLNELMGYIQANKSRISAIYLASYLYNNEELHDFLKQMAAGGKDVFVISIPLEGYDNRHPAKIIDAGTGITTLSLATKASLAESIYTSMRESLPPSFNFYVFPHVYVRSPRMNFFSRGALPYSLHVKAALIKMKDGSGAVVGTSSNLAVRDWAKYEMMEIIEGDDSAAECTERFFSDLIANSIPLADFDEAVDWTKYPMKFKDFKPAKSATYIAPFYADSPLHAEKEIIKVMSQAEKRILVCAQHLSAYKYWTRQGTSDGILSKVLEKAQEGLDVKCISQTFVNGFVQDREFREPENTSSFKRFIEQYFKSSNAQYFVNENIHEKYIIADDTLIATTCNFTPTQFIYEKNVDIPSFDKRAELSYHGTFSEVGQFLFIGEKAIVSACLQRFNNIISKPETVWVK